MKSSEIIKTEGIASGIANVSTRIGQGIGKAASMAAPGIKAVQQAIPGGYSSFQDVHPYGGKTTTGATAQPAATPATTNFAGDMEFKPETKDSFKKLAQGQVASKGTDNPQVDKILRGLGLLK